MYKPRAVAAMQTVQTLEDVRKSTPQIRRNAIISVSKYLCYPLRIEAATRRKLQVVNHGSESSSPGCNAYSNPGISSGRHTVKNRLLRPIAFDNPIILSLSGPIFH